MKRNHDLWMLLAVTSLVASGCALPGYNFPPPERLAAPGPGVTGPGPGVLTSLESAGVSAGGGAVTIGPDGVPCYDGGFGDGGFGDGSGLISQSVQVWFAKPDEMQINWDVSSVGQFDSEPLIVPGKQNFQAGAVYRLKVSNVPGHEGDELYPTLEIGPPTPSTLAFLAHNAIPIQYTSEDFNQVKSGNFVTKVIYLPDPEFQELAVAGVETLVSTRLDPGVDPIVEADRRGAILAIVRIGNKDLTIPGTEGSETILAPTLGDDSVAQAGYAGGPVPMGQNFGPGLHVAGINSPPFGMPITGTPIGLPGPPHIPFGVPAGLKKHSITNHTNMHLPGPTESVKIHVKQSPRISYPAPRDRAWIHQHNHPTCSACAGAKYH